MAKIEVHEDTILVNLHRCTGCWTCACACKVGNNLPDPEWWLTVRTLGSGEGIDRPAGTWGNLHMDWIPIWSKKCVKCPARRADGDEPYCVYNCPHKALFIGEKAAEEMEKLREKGYRIYQLGSFENTKDNIIYADKQ